MSTFPPQRSSPGAGSSDSPGAGAGLLIPGNDTWERSQRQMFKLLVILQCLATALALWKQAAQPDPLDRLALPALALWLIGLQVLLSLGRLSIRRALQWAYVGGGTYLLLALSHQFSVLGASSRTLMENTYWFAVLYSAAFLTYSPRQAQRLTGGILALATLICLWHLALTVPAAARSQLTGASAQFLLTGAVIIVMQATLGVQHSRLMATRAAAYRDALTGLANRRAAEEHLRLRSASISGAGPGAGPAVRLGADPASAARGAAGGEGYTLVLFDLDHFKQINDRFGHATGDLVLRRVGQSVLRHLPPGGLAARWGGEEFLLVLPPLSTRKVRQVLEDLRADLHAVRQGELRGVTACFGVASRRPGEHPDSVLARADEAMYHVKARGRNDMHHADVTETRLT